MASVVVAVSGGLDSACALLLLKQAGHEAIALHALLAPGSSPPLNLERLCNQLDVRLEVVDLRTRFAELVISPFAQGYADGFTPNPCVCCNRSIKFGAMLDHARGLGAEFYATGHYARLTTRPDGRVLIAPALDASRDQGYFLSLVSAEKLALLKFPLADFHKSDLPALLAAAGIEYAHSDTSRDICFTDPRSDLDSGPILLREPGEEMASPEALRRIGIHRGLAFYTVGQRQGLEIPWREALYVREKDAVANALIVAPRQMLDMRACVATQLNFFVPSYKWPKRVFARLRYRQALLPASVEWREPFLHIYLREPVFAAARGQIAAIYADSGVILAGGVIEEILF